MRTVFKLLTRIFHKIAFRVRISGFLSSFVLRPSSFRQALATWLFLLSAGTAFSAQTVRVTTWDFAATPMTGRSNSNVVEQTAIQLKRLAPDVILLRGINGWKMCSQLTEALKPADYRVIVCSAFRPAEGSTNPVNQVAILARNAGYFSWSEAWSFQINDALRGGFAFAAAQVAGHRFGFSCLELGANQKASSEQAARQFLMALDPFRSWANNRLEGFVAGVFGFNYPEGETGRVLRAGGFGDALAGNTQPLPAGQTLETHLLPNPDSPSGLVLNRWPMTCELDFRPAPIIVLAGNPAPPPAAAPKALASTSIFERSAMLWWLGIALLLVLSLIALMQVSMRRKLARLQAQGALVPLVSGSYNVLLPPPGFTTSDTGAVPPGNLPLALPAPNSSADQATLLANLTQWLKQAVVQKLLRDRKKLMAVQEAATIKALAVDERLANLEAKIHSQNASYEKQIEELTRELLTAREENCDLIRAQINMLKAEMGATRARMLASELA